MRSICFVKLEISIFEKMGHFRNVNLNGTTTKPNLLLEELGSSTIACLSTKPWTIISRVLSWNVEAWRLIERQWHMIIKNRHSQNIEYFFIDWFSNSVSKDKITYQCKIHSNFKKKSNFLNRDRPRDRLRPWKKKFFFWSIPTQFFMLIILVYFFWKSDHWNRFWTFLDRCQGRPLIFAPRTILSKNTRKHHI